METNTNRSEDEMTLFKIVICGMFAMGNFNCVPSPKEQLMSQTECESAAKQLREKDNLKNFSITCVAVK